MTMHASDTDPAARIADLEHQLELERARNAGLESGLTALDRRVTELRAENAALRAELEGRAVDRVGRFVRAGAEPTPA